MSRQQVTATMICVTAAIIQDQDRILAARKREGLPLAGYWEFPGGKIEPGESPEECLQRELREELGLECIIGEQLGESIYDYGHKKVRLLGYFAQAKDTRVRLTDHDRVCWLKIDELRSVDWAPADIPLVNLLEEHEVRALTLAYYDSHEEDYIDRTIKADMSKQLEAFTALLPEHAHILDVGCGSGRDSRYLLDRGYRVFAIDPSKKLAERAAASLSIPVECCGPHEIPTGSRFHGIWACASLIHEPHTRLAETVTRLTGTLVPGGVLYMSFRQGTSSGWDKHGRYINDMDDQKLQNLLYNTPLLKLLRTWISPSVLPEADEKWFNILCGTEESVP